MGGNVETLADEFLLLFKRHLNGTIKAQLRMVTCVSVDWDEKTMVCEDENELPYHNVALGLGAIMTKPAVGCECIIAILEAEDSVAWLIHTDEADEIVFRDGENGGLTITPELKKQLDTMTKRIDAVYNAINNSAVAPGDGGATFKTNMVAVLSTVTQKEDFSKIEDEKIKH